MCCFSVADVFLEDPPPEKKKEEKVKKDYVLVSDQLNLQPIVSRHRFSAIPFPTTFTSLPLPFLPFLLFPSHHLIYQQQQLLFSYKIGESIVVVSISPSEAISQWSPT